MARFALTGADVFDGTLRRSGMAVIVEDTLVADIRPVGDLPNGLETIVLDGGLLAPGFVDIQVNGGGGTLFNHDPTVEGIRRICAAHSHFGSTALLPTVITDRPEVTWAAIRAAEQALAARVPGCLGIHVEGPFIAPARKGAHDPALIRRMGDDDLRLICGSTVRPFLLTVAPESVDGVQVAALVEAGISVSIGHSNASFEAADALFEAGARGATHLFNAMSQIGPRDPGVAGAALFRRDIWCGIIPDGHHVHPALIDTARRSKDGTGKLIAVTDAMPTVGSPEDTFELNGRTVTRRDGLLTLSDGTLAGSDLNMMDALRFLVRMVGFDLEEALRTCSLYPATFLRSSGIHGIICAGSQADMVWIDPENLLLHDVWVAGRSILGLVKRNSGKQRNIIPEYLGSARKN